MAGEVNVKGKVAMVTGASSGMGRNHAKVLAAHGATVALCARRIDLLEQCASEISADGGSALVVPMDAAKVPSIRNAAALIEDKLGPIDILVNNAAVTKQAPVLDIEEDYFDWIFDIDIKGALFVAQAAARQMIKHGLHGRIINIASGAGIRTMRRQAVYGAAKAALIQASRVMALEWAPENINVNVLCPGYIETEMSVNFPNTEAGAKFIDTLPRKRAGKPDDFAGILLLLSSVEASRFITGTVIPVDDGASNAWLPS